MVLVQEAFKGEQHWLKGGLHCHTTRSDGVGTPEEVIRFHVDHGYDFLALTDHQIYNFKNFTDLPITIIPGMEMARSIKDRRYGNCFHTVCIGPAEGNGYRQDEVFENGVVEDQYEYQAILDDIHARHNLTFYCHPEWSFTPAQSFMHMKGNFAMEIWNSASVLFNDEDGNAAYWDELLWSGQKIWGVATDDGHAMHDHCHGWVMVNAENNIPAILEALKEGRFYSSTGPEIYDFHAEDGVAKVTCSPVSKVQFSSWTLPTRMIKGENLTTWEKEIPERCKYVRACVIDSEGHRAWTNPVFLP